MLPAAGILCNRRLPTTATCRCPLLQVEGELDRSAFDSAKPNDVLLKLRRTQPYYQVREAAGAGGLLAVVVLPLRCTSLQQRGGGRRG